MSAFSEKVDALEKRLQAAEEKIQRLEMRLINVRNSPIIVGYQGKRLVVNDHLDAVSVNTKLTDFETRIAALE